MYALTVSYLGKTWDSVAHKMATSENFLENLDGVLLFRFGERWMVCEEVRTNAISFPFSIKLESTEGDSVLLLWFKFSPRMCHFPISEEDVYSHIF